jgi:hypothetical protein
VETSEAAYAVDEARIEALLSHVEPDFQAPCSEMLRGGAMTFAQSWQDWLVYHNVIKPKRGGTPDWGDGYYLDVGASTAFEQSNTLFFDKCLGWRGLCFEPQSQYHANFARRSCALVPHCVLGRAAIMRVDNAGSTWSVSELASAADVAAGGAIECVSFADALAAHSESAAVPARGIDFVSLDIEGNEAGVLRCFPLVEHNVSVFAVETNRQNLNHVASFFHRNNYVLDDTVLWSDTTSAGANHPLDHIFVKRDRPLLRPSVADFKCTPFMRERRTIGSQSFCTAYEAVKSGVFKWGPCDAATDAAAAAAERDAAVVEANARSAIALLHAGNVNGAIAAARIAEGVMQGSLRGALGEMQRGQEVYRTYAQMVQAINTNSLTV